MNNVLICPLGNKAIISNEKDVLLQVRLKMGLQFAIESKVHANRMRHYVIDNL